MLSGSILNDLRENDIGNVWPDRVLYTLDGGDVLPGFSLPVKDIFLSYYGKDAAKGEQSA